MEYGIRFKFSVYIKAIVERQSYLFVYILSKCDFTTMLRIEELEQGLYVWLCVENFPVLALAQVYCLILPFIK